MYDANHEGFAALQLALCYLKPDVTITGGLGKALKTLFRRGYRIHGYHVMHMNDRLYRLTYEKGFDAARDSWQINHRFASIGPWIALLLNHTETSTNLQARLKREQGPAIPLAGTGIRAEMGHGNRLQNCIHVPDTSHEVAEQIAVIFPDANQFVPQAEIDAQEIIAEFQQHGYEPQQRTFSEFQGKLGRRVAHRATRIARTSFLNDSAWPTTIESSTVARALETLTLSTSELSLMKTLLVGDCGIGSNRLLKAMNIDELMTRNFIYLTEWDRAMLFGYVAYPTIEAPIYIERNDP